MNHAEKRERVLEIHEKVSRMERLKTQVSKKLAKGKSIAEIADALEEETVIAGLVKELEAAANKAIDDTEKI